MKQDGIIFTKRDCLICGVLADVKELLPLDCLGKQLKCVQCKNCGLIYVDPMPILKVQLLDELYSDKLLSDYQRSVMDCEAPLSQITKKAMKNQIREIQKYKLGGKILDVGCGNGWFLKTAMENGWEAFGVEVSKRLSDYIRDRLGVTVFHGRLEEADFHSKFFDVIHLRHIIEHFPNPDVVLTEVRCLLKDDGLIFIQAPNAATFSVSILIWMNKNLGRLCRRKIWNAAIPDPPYHLYGFSLKCMKALLLKKGFRVIKSFTIKSYHPIYWPYDPSVGEHTSNASPCRKDLSFWLKVSLLPDSQFVIYAKKAGQTQVLRG